MSSYGGVSLLYRTEAIGRQQTHTPQKVRGEESVLSAPHIHSRVDFRIFSSMLPPLPRFVFTDVIRDGHCGARTCMASPSMRRRGPWAVPDARASWHLLANQTLFEVSLCRPTAPGLPIWGTGDFGTSPIFRQLSDKPLLACVCSLGVSERKAPWRTGTFNATRKRFLLCWRRRSRGHSTSSKPEQAKPEVGSRSSLEVPLAARFDLSSPGLVIVKTGKVELGQGILLALRQIAAEELDLTADAVVTVSGDTSTSLFEGGTVGSMSIETSGCELRDAAAELRAVLLDAAARKLGMSVSEITAEDGEIFVAGIRSKETFWSLAAEIPFDRVLERSAVPKSPEALQDGRDEHAADAIA
jgi:hypothetical protein